MTDVRTPERTEGGGMSAATLAAVLSAYVTYRSPRKGDLERRADRRPVGPRTVEADCHWLRWVFNWAPPRTWSRWRRSGVVESDGAAIFRSSSTSSTARDAGYQRCVASPTTTSGWAWGPMGRSGAPQQPTRPDARVPCRSPRRCAARSTAFWRASRRRGLAAVSLARRSRTADEPAPRRQVAEEG